MCTILRIEVEASFTEDKQFLHSSRRGNTNRDGVFRKIDSVRIYQLSYIDLSTKLSTTVARKTQLELNLK